ncbi:LEC14B homolog [Linum perenne]
MRGVRSKFSRACDERENAEAESSRAGGVEGESSDQFDHEIVQLTKLRSEPHERYRRDSPACGGRSRAPVSTLKMLAGREANCSGRGRFSSADGCHVLSSTRSRAYVSQFSSDGSLFIAGFQGSHIRIYNVENGWKVQKNILAKSLRWTITDTCLSPDQRYLVYASLSPIVHIVDIGSSTTDSLANVTEIHDGLDFSNSDYEYEDEFGIFSADVNTVCFADETGHVIYSGSDDHLCKVWDRRCFNSRGQAAGVLMGHLEGVTFIDSRGDGRTPRLRDPDWDYRWMEYPERDKTMKHPRDMSLATYVGHSVLRTLIRCYFSPEYSTGKKYIYTGSSDNCVHIYDLVSGAQVGCLDGHEGPVRDCSWHPVHPILVSSSWDGRIVRWEFPEGASSASTLRVKKRTSSRHVLY